MLMGATAKKQYQSTTVRLPEHVYRQAKDCVEKRSESLNEFFVKAVKDRLKALREAAIDAAFAGMKEDEEYQRDAVALTRQFAASDWDAFRLTENEPRERNTSSQAHTGRRL